MLGSSATFGHADLRPWKSQQILLSRRQRERDCLLTSKLHKTLILHPQLPPPSDLSFSLMLLRGWGRDWSSNSASFVKTNLQDQDLKMLDSLHLSLGCSISPAQDIAEAISSCKECCKDIIIIIISLWSRLLVLCFLNEKNWAKTMLVKIEIYQSGRAKAPCILARTSRNSSSSCFVSSFLFTFSLPSKTGTATKIFDKKTRSRSSCNLRTWWNRRRRRRQFSFVAVNESLSKMRQGSETAERRETERLPVVASVYESIVVLPRTKIWSYRERRGFVYPRCQAQGARRASLSGNTRERTANVRERRRTTTTTWAGGSIMKFHLCSSSIIGVVDFVKQQEQQLMFFGFFYCRRNLQCPVLSS